MVEARAIWDDRVAVVCHGVRHGGGQKNVLPHVVRILRARCAFDGTTYDGVSVRRVAELCAWLRQQRVVGKELQPAANRVIEMFDIPDFGIVVRLRLVMANAAEMREQQAGCDRSFPLRKRRTVLLHGCIEVQLSAFRELHRRHGSERFRDGGQSVEGLRGCGYESLEIGHAESSGPGVLAILHYSGGQAGNLIGRHELRDGLFNLGALLGSKFGILGGKSQRSCDEKRRPNNDPWQRGPIDELPAGESGDPENPTTAMSIPACDLHLRMPASVLSASLVLIRAHRRK